MHRKEKGEMAMPSGISMKRSLLYGLAAILHSTYCAQASAVLACQDADDEDLPLQVATATIGWDSSTWMPALEPHPAVTSFLQHSALLAGAGLSALLTLKLTSKPWTAWLPYPATIAAFTAELWYLMG